MMTESSETQTFSTQLEGLFDTPSPGLQDEGLEALILGRIVRRRRLRAGVLAIGTVTGVGIAIYSLSLLQLPSIWTGPLFELLSGNSLINFLYAALGAGGVTSVVVAGVLTVLGLAFARVLEEV